jgi:hypothetical protein
MPLSPHIFRCRSYTFFIGCHISHSLDFSGLVAYTFALRRISHLILHMRYPVTLVLSRSAVLRDVVAFDFRRHVCRPFLFLPCLLFV